MFPLVIFWQSLGQSCWISRSDEKITGCSLAQLLPGALVEGLAWRCCIR
jgi:hypothetical protein